MLVSSSCLLKSLFSLNIITIITIINIITIITVIFMITIISVIFISPARLLHWADWLPVEGQVWKWSAQNLGGGGQCILLISSKGFWIISISSFWLQLIDLILFETVGDPVGQAPGGNRRSLHVSWPTLWESHAATNITKDHNDKQMMVMLWRVKMVTAGTRTHEHRNFHSISRIASLRDPSLSFRDIAPFRFVWSWWW